MARELEKVIAVLLRPEIKSVGGEIPERLEVTVDAMTLFQSPTEYLELIPTTAIRPPCQGYQFQSPTEYLELIPK